MSNLQKRKKTHLVHCLKTGKEIPTLKINITLALFDDLDLLIQVSLEVQAYCKHIWWIREEKNVT